MISIDNISLQFVNRTLFKNVSFLVNPKDRIGLVGKNGAGKTTLMKIILGQQPVDEGKVTIPNDATLGYLAQQIRNSSEKTVYEEAKTAFQQIIDIEKKIEKINIELSERTDYESSNYLKLIELLNEHNEHLAILGGNNYDGDIEKTLIGLGFTREDFARSLNEFSGGWRMRVELAKILLKRPNVLLLDEPTNHLDIESIQWLEDYLISYPGAIILISHDRAFLDNITNRTIEISLAKTYDYNAPYSQYVELRKEQLELQQSAYNNQQKMIEKTEEFIERFRYKATKAVQVQSRIKQLEKIDRIEIEEQDNSRINIQFPPAPRSGSIVVETEHLSKKYDELQVLKNIDLIVERGEKVAFVGKNGEGKTTLSRIIVDELDYTGTFKLGHNVKIGYFAQNQETLLDGEKTVLQTIDDVAVGDVRTKIRDILGSFLFGGEDVEKKVKVLSGGEKSRLAIAKLLLEPYNLLVLDEPTNHLDMYSKDILKNALINYTGTLIVVSHDREFLNGLTEKIFEFRNKNISEFRGGIYDFLKKKKIETLDQLNLKQKEIDTGNIGQPVSENKLNYEERKKLDREIRKAENKVKDAEKKIEELERKIEKRNEVFYSTDEKTKELLDDNFYKEYNGLKAELEKEMNNWETYQTEVEELKNQRI